MPQESNTAQLLTADDLAAILKTTRKSVYSMVERGQIPRSAIFRLGRLLRFRAHEVESWIGSHGEGKKP